MMMQQLPISGDHFALVDDDVFAWASKHRWHSSGWKGRYVARRGSAKGSTVYLHREILNAPNGLEVDHINGDPLDNQRSNLRVVTHAQNQQNRHAALSTSTTGVRGVRWEKRRKRYRALLYLHGRVIYFGVFKTLEAASAAAAAGRAAHFTHSAECGEK